VGAAGAERAGDDYLSLRDVPRRLSRRLRHNPKTMKRTSKGRKILTSAAALTAVGGFLADWNRTHLFNPNWPPHARFHDALTITLGSLLGASGLYFLRSRGKDPQRDLALGVLLPSVFWVAQGASFVFPGAKGFEAEFPEKVPPDKGRVDQRAVLQCPDAGADRDRLHSRTEEPALVLGQPPASKLRLERS
jgi:hypothetical protein